MSSPSPVPIPTPTPSILPSTATLKTIGLWVLSLAMTWVSTVHWGTNQVPVPPNGGGGQQQSVPDGGQKKADPPPVTGPVACITDPAGNPLPTTMDYGKLLIVSSVKSNHAKSASSISWQVSPTLQQFPTADGTLALVSPIVPTTITITQTVSLNDVMASTSVAIQVGQKQQQQQDQQQNNPPLPPAQKLENAAIIILEDDANPTMDVARIFADFMSWKQLSDAGVPWSRQPKTSTDPMAQKALSALLAKNVNVAGPVAGYAIYDRKTGSIAYCDKLVSRDETKLHLTILTGQAI